MERKYYLRGLGIGIAVTAIIMGIAVSGDKAMTDDEIIARAKELGMVENTVLTNSDDEAGGEENTDAQDGADEVEDVAQFGQENPRSEDLTASDEEDGTAADGEEDEDIVTPADTDKPDTNDDGQETTGSSEEPETEEEPDTANDIADDTETGNETPESQTGSRPESVGGITSSATVKTITINHGDGSYTVARKLAEVGVVTSADTFDSFLCQNGYDKRLRTGTFSIPADASDEQIARIVTGAE
ncbi:MAG: hypothetical protein HDR09_19495 [Lachnospiraceae bacterium]|nr:hypothetical protein [Lachnospiraceae bacterium]